MLELPQSRSRPHLQSRADPRHVARAEGGREVDAGRPRAPRRPRSPKSTGRPRILSSYDATSEFSRWFGTRNVAVPVSPELFEVLSLFDAWRARTSGALDASAEAASRVWKTAAARQRLPSEAEIAAAVFSVQQTHWSLRASDRSATHLSDVPLVLSSFTKSYILDRAARAALAIDGVSGVVVNIGGDLVVRGDWTEAVAVANPANDAENSEPLARLAVRDRAVATSGSYRRGVEIDGRHYSHIVDPRTGRPAGHIVSATVVASDAATAGALATAFSVLRPDESRALAATMPGVEYLLVERDGGRIQSAAWHTLGIETARAIPRAADALCGRTGHVESSVRADRQPRAREGGRFRRQASVRGRLDRRQGPASRADAGAVVSEVPLVARPQVLVPGRSAAGARRRHRAHRVGLERDAPRRQVLARSGTARTTRGSRSRPASTPSASRPRASTARIKSSARRWTSRRCPNTWT